MYVSPAVFRLPNIDPLIKSAKQSKQFNTLLRPIQIDLPICLISCRQTKNLQALAPMLVFRTDWPGYALPTRRQHKVSLSRDQLDTYFILHAPRMNASCI
jgi:hypothetical protein